NLHCLFGLCLLQIDKFQRESEFEHAPSTLTVPDFYISPEKLHESLHNCQPQACPAILSAGRGGCLGTGLEDCCFLTFRNSDSCILTDNSDIGLISLGEFP